MKSWSLRAQLTFWSALVTGLALLTLAAITTASVWISQLENVDDHLAAEADLIFAALPAGAASAGQAAGLLRANNEVLYGFALGPTSGQAALIYPASLAPLALAWPPAAGTRMTEFHGRHLRIGVFVKGDRALLLAADLAAARETIGALLVAYGVALPVVLLVIAGGSWWIARRALAPVAAITAAARAITADKLAARLPAPRAEDEIARLTRVLNDMFDRLERSFAQARRFSADTSHELRTPLTILRGEAEEALRTGGFSAEQEKILISLLEQVGGLQKIADNLLLLSSFDAGKNPVHLAPIDFTALVSDAAEDAELLAAPAGLKVSADLTPGVRVAGDTVLLRRLLLNLVDNAVRYNHPDGEVHLALRREESAAVLTVANTGPGIPPERRGELFQRFFRLAADRNRATGGSGLGLSLCREIATAHGGRIELVGSEAGRTEFAVHLPTSSHAD